MKVSIVIPCYNEEAGIAQLRTKMKPVIASLCGGHEIELILIDDGSSDRTFAVLEEAFHDCPEARIVRHSHNQNLGGAIRTGVREATGDVVSFMDSDCTYDPELLIGMIGEVERGADVVTVSPYHPKGEVIGVPPHRLFLSKTLSTFYRVLLQKNIYTFTAMNRAFKRDVLRSVGSPESDFTSVAEMMLKSLKQGFRVVEVPAKLSVRKFGESKLRTARVIRGHLRLITRLIFNPASYRT